MLTTTAVLGLMAGCGNRVIHLGSYDGAPEQLTDLEGDVTVAVVR